MIKWTKSELNLFEQYDRIMDDLASISDDAMYMAPSIHSPVMNQIEEMAGSLDKIRDDLKSLMGTTRYFILMSDFEVQNIWRDQIVANWSKKCNCPWEV